jgi:general secretion pathway protein K
LEAFKKLLSLIDGDPAIADELFLWLDSDSGIDFNYSDQLPSYAPSYLELSDLSELLLLTTVDRDVLNKIYPYLSALPSDSALNINTAPVEVIQSIAFYLDEAIANQALTDRDEVGFSSVTDFLNHEVFKENEDAGIYLANLSVTSSWFELYTAVTLNEKTLTQRSIVHRDEQGHTTLTLRDRSAKESNPIPGDPIKQNSADPESEIEELENN